MLSLDDIKIHEREQEFKKEAKKRAQILLKSCLEDQMRERGLQSNISKYEEHLRDGIIIDKIKQLELEHQSKVSILYANKIFLLNFNLVS